MCSSSFFARVTPRCILVKMSVDFGPIPMPTSPIQEYFERKYSRVSSENVSPAIPKSPPPVNCGIEEQLTKALNELARKQAAEAQKSDASPGSPRPDDGTPLNVLPQHRGSLAASTGYTALCSDRNLKRRSLAGGSAGSQSSSRRSSP